MRGIQGRYTAINIDPIRPDKLPTAYQRYLDGATFLVGDAARLPLPDKSYDFVVSYATLKHIMPTSDRALFASEVMRVGRLGYMVVAPSYWTLVEPHYLLPGFQFLPEAAKRLMMSTRLNFVCKHRQYEYAAMALPTKRELRRLFPNATISRIGIPGLAHSIVAIGEIR